MSSTGPIERRPFSAIPKSSKLRSPALTKVTTALQTSSSKCNFSRRPETAKKNYFKSPDLRSITPSMLEEGQRG